MAADCAMKAVNNGATKADIFTRKNICDIQLPKKELHDILHRGININARSRITEICLKNGKVSGIKIIHLDNNLRDINGTKQFRSDFDIIVLAIKNIPAFKKKISPEFSMPVISKTVLPLWLNVLAAAKMQLLKLTLFLKVKN